jgi:copper resistance protein B
MPPKPAPIPDAEAAKPPSPPTDRAADRYFPAEDMAVARDRLEREHGGGTAWLLMVDTAELGFDDETESYAWGGFFRVGGAVNRMVVKTEGEGEVGGDLHAAEAQLLYSRAIGPYFDLQAGVRHDFEPSPTRSHLVLGVEGLAPYWFEIGASAFLSDEGELTTRFEAEHDLRLTQNLVLQPSVEAELAARDAPDLGRGAGLTSAEFGLRLRYHFSREFAPYVGVTHWRAFGETADIARAAGDAREETAVVLGLRAWF